MNKIVVLFVLFFSVGIVSAQEKDSVIVEEKIHAFVQEKAYPPGTDFEPWKKTLMHEMKQAWNLSFSEVLLRVVIEKDGSVTNLRVISDEWKPTDEMVSKLLEMINAKGKWLPAKHNGLQVRSSYRIKMIFQI
ncbi:hypothetical protein P3875_09555 [Myroides sp. JBRI-B21084]|uniref:energy transducer TonB n=1 Tax=Myroides sp. JBRI-B21084 TaxID=3119977 RepID=UPI0026E2B790|nr:energy transducer TonB [Paenimyroides cloacae]WKW46021.1 hypothetical protein P3875_09555 [Paenimyroides cloacae]